MTKKGKKTPPANSAIADDAASVDEEETFIKSINLSREPFHMDRAVKAAKRISPILKSRIRNSTDTLPVLHASFALMLREKVRKRVSQIYIANDLHVVFLEVLHDSEFYPLRSLVLLGIIRLMIFANKESLTVFAKAGAAAPIMFVLIATLKNIETNQTCFESKGGERITINNVNLAMYARELWDHIFCTDLQTGISSFLQRGQDLITRIIWLLTYSSSINDEEFGMWIAFNVCFKSPSLLRQLTEIDDLEDFDIFGHLANNIHRYTLDLCEKIIEPLAENLLNENTACYIVLDINAISKLVKAMGDTGVENAREHVAFLLLARASWWRCNIRDKCMDKEFSVRLSKIKQDNQSNLFDLAQRTLCEIGMIEDGIQRFCSQQGDQYPKELVTELTCYISNVLNIA